MKKTFYLETLGCPRNESDSEAIINNLINSYNFNLSETPEDSDIIVVNGCAFIKEAVLESIETILNLREKNKDALFVVVGCLAQRYGEELKKNLEEIDLIVGTGSIEKLPELIIKGKSEVTSNSGFLGRSIFLNSPSVTPSHYRYLKIQEGCDFKCSFCIIPKIKGGSRSKGISLIKEEIKSLPPIVKELIVVGQNTTSWGKDLGEGENLSKLIGEIAPLFPGWIRFLYFHPLSISDELLRIIHNFSNLINYLDIPFQHVSDSVLSYMRRGYGRKEIEELLEMIDKVGEFTVRTTFIIGFPEEKEEDFKELCDFIEKSNFDHIGIFEYSPEEGSTSYYMPCLKKKIIKERMREISKIIERKMEERSKKFIGKVVEVLIDGKESGEYFGRMKSSAPEIDPVVWIPGNFKIKVGEIYPVVIKSVLGGDFVGELK
ncbi:MAG: 30S ribosomal protein S12 methylthiotransferase RimO [candidate division WOR-3 bacterium]